MKKKIKTLFVSSGFIVLFTQQQPTHLRKMWGKFAINIQVWISGITVANQLFATNGLFRILDLLLVFPLNSPYL